ncbi:MULTISPECIES: RICIN domain-containing protein [unclassified Streptomyces]|uniref:RICIN domain-containing protein n=1 Tax=unclassified Streptomyces TaxID=2593676 RepID=UPI0036B64F17
MTGLDGQHPSAGQQLGNALRALQRRSGRTLRSLESEVLISDSSLSRYLRGSTVPPWATVRDLCRALGADPAEYRALWEAADRCQPKPPPAAGGPTPTAPATGSRWRRWRRTAGEWAQHRWAWAVGGTCAGLLCGGALAAFLLWPSGQEPARGAGAPQESAHPAAAGPQGAPPVDHSRIFVNRVTGNCLDHSLDKGLRSFEPNGLSYQRWTVRANPDGGSELRNHATGACLDGGASGLRGASCSKAVSQQWAVTALADASVEIRSRSSGTCLEDGGQGLRAVPCDGSDRQRWG